MQLVAEMGLEFSIFTLNSVFQNILHGTLLTIDARTWMAAIVPNYFTSITSEIVPPNAMNWI